ncbi:MAG: DUF2007 domain-containing protein [Lachnospiraceae bacterium]|nr:DUF2007 domain-containing protein [Lachnospiraceae bacterium]
MFRKGSIPDPELVMVYNTASKWEADQAESLLANEGIPAMIRDREDSGDYLRVLGFGSPFGMDVYVHRDHAQRAKELLEATFSGKEDISEEELEALALQTEADEL